jgi:hypothetical protein
VEKFFARNLGGLTCARPRAGPAREGRSRTPSVYVGEKSDEVVVPKKRSNKGRQLPAEIVEGRASPEGNSRQAAVVRTLSRVATSIRLAAVRRRARGFTVCRLTFDPREEPGALAAHAGICRGAGSNPRPYRDHAAPVQWITSSASTIRVGGIVMAKRLGSSKIDGQSGTLLGIAPAIH